MNKSIRSIWFVSVATAGLLVSACGSDEPKASTESTEVAAPTTEAASDASSAATEAETETSEAAGEGTVPANQPDVNQDGKVVIGVLSPGDLNDNGYYESFVQTANDFADEQGWTIIPVGQVNPSDAVQAARDLCAQGVDMVAVAAAELRDALPVAEEDVCAGTVWYSAGGDGIEQQPYFVQTSNNTSDSQFFAGAAAGLVIQDLGKSKVAFITGPELDFSVIARNSFAAGVKSIVPDAEVSATYTGDFDDAAKAVEAANAVVADSEVGLIYPYLGGATDAVVQVGAQAGVRSITPGTDRCSEPDFAISSLFSPGVMFYGSLVDFAAGKLEIGVTKHFEIGIDEVPNVVICDATPEQDAALEEVRAGIASGAIDSESLAAAES